MERTGRTVPGSNGLRDIPLSVLNRCANMTVHPRSRLDILASRAVGKPPTRPQSVQSSQSKQSNVSNELNRLRSEAYEWKLEKQKLCDKVDAAELEVMYAEELKLELEELRLERNQVVEKLSSSFEQDINSLHQELNSFKSHIDTLHQELHQSKSESAGQIAAYEQDLTNAKQEMKCLIDQVAMFEERETYLTGQIDTMGCDLDEAQERLASLQLERDREALDQAAQLITSQNAVQRLLDDSARWAQAAVTQHNCIVDLETRLEKATEEATAAKVDHEIDKSEIENVRNSLVSAESLISDLQERLGKLKAVENESSDRQLKLQERESIIATLRAEKSSALESLQQEQQLRRYLHRQLVDVIGNVQVFCRVRPFLPAEHITDVLHVQKNKNGLSCLTVDELVKTYDSKNEKKVNHFKFDEVFSSLQTNAHVFSEVALLIESVFEGYNVCIFAYGQTGSGKTYTMTSDNGIIPSSLQKIFDTVQASDEWSYEVSCQCIEIYNDTLVDLLATQHSETGGPKLEIRHDADTNMTSVVNATRIQLVSQAQSQSVLDLAMKRRVTGSTSMNERSSRSHTIFIVQVRGLNHKTAERSHGALNLIDLAGSERLNSSKTVGRGLKETQSINKSLSCLGDVIAALARNKPGSHIPYRNSKLTYLLQQSLGNNSKTLMVVNVSPCEVNVFETLSSLRFASKVNKTILKQ